MQNKTNNFNESLVRSVGKSGGNKILENIVDLSLKNIIDSELIKKIPIVGTIVSTYKIGTSISDYIFLKKLLHFLNELHKITDSDKEEMLERLNSDEEFSNSVGENLIQIIDKCDDIRKAKIIAKLFNAYVKRGISYTEFYSFSLIINHSYLFDLSLLHEYIAEGAQIKDPGKLLGLGILGIKTKHIEKGKPISLGNIGNNNQIEFFINEDGYKLYEIIKNYI